MRPALNSHNSLKPSSSTEFFEVAENVFSVTWDDDVRSWGLIKWHFAPFAVEGMPSSAAFSVRLARGERPDFEGAVVYAEDEDDGRMRLRVLSDGSGNTLFEMIRSGAQAPDCWLLANADFSRMAVTTAAWAEDKSPRQCSMTLSGALMLAFMLATLANGTLLTHASAIVCDGRAWLFQGKSGTGKSTHSRLWVCNVEGAELLNDDHPVIRLPHGGRGAIMAYGSPWSGKTPCYRNAGAPLGAMVRIKRAPENMARRLKPLEAYASLTTSVFGAPFHRRLEQARQSWLERIVSEVPCYELQCRPDADAARVCKAALIQS